MCNKYNVLTACVVIVKSGLIKPVFILNRQVYRALRAVGVELTDIEKKELRRELEDDLALWSSLLPLPPSIWADHFGVFFLQR